MKEAILKESARWIHANKHGGYWTPLALTSANAGDPHNPHLSESDANLVFTILEERRLMLPEIYEMDSGGKKIRFRGYKYNSNKEADWEELTKIGFWKVYLWPSIKWCWKKSWIFVLFFIGMVFTGFFTGLFETLGEKSGDKIYENFLHNDKANVTTVGEAAKPPGK